MCTLKAHINKSIFGKVLLGIEKVVKTFSIPNKLFPKLVYYCVPLWHTLIKSLKIKLEVAVDKLVNTECGHVTEHVPSQYTACSCHEPLDGMGSGTDH